MSSAFAALLARIRSFSLSIGQLTFGSFLLLLAVIAATSMGSIIALRHINSTFAELPGGHRTGHHFDCPSLGIDIGTAGNARTLRAGNLQPTRPRGREKPFSGAKPGRR